MLNKRRLFLKGLHCTGGLRLLESVPAWSGLLVLNYHRIGNAAESLFDRALWSATANDFDEHVKLLKQNCEIVGLDDLPAVVRDLEKPRQRSRSRFGMITFDDGYLDNFEVAFPILKSHEVPAVFFVTTGFLDHGRLGWWDEISWMIRSSSVHSLDLTDWVRKDIPVDRPGCDLAISQVLRFFYGLDSLRAPEFLEFLAQETQAGRAPESLSDRLWMNWTQIREMQASGMSIGAHTVNHPVLSRLSAEEQSFEICESKLRIEQETNKPVTAFSYPVGRRDAFDETTQSTLRHHGFDWGFSYYGGFTASHAVPTERWNPLDIPRVAVESDTTLADFRSYVALPQIFSRH